MDGITIRININFYLQLNGMMILIRLYDNVCRVAKSSSSTSLREMSRSSQASSAP